MFIFHPFYKESVDIWHLELSRSFFSSSYVFFFLFRSATTLEAVVSGMQSRLGNKRKWVSLPLEEVSRDDADKTSGGFPAQSDTSPISDSSDPMSPNQRVHDNRAHYDSRSKWPGTHFYFFPFSLPLFASSLCSFLLFNPWHSCVFTHHLFPNRCMFYTDLFSITHGWMTAWPQSYFIFACVFIFSFNKVKM